ncbi:uncharacterized protein EV420DRAFT_1258580, partial [Desarmillaria tabescens]
MKASLKRKSRNDHEDDDCVDDEGDDNIEDVVHVPFEWPHKELQTHTQVLLPESKKLVPIPWGGSLPRRDRSSMYQRYCRLMLIFFKPWKHGKDLRVSGLSWSEVFSLFCEEHPWWNDQMDNMQMLHECRDSRNDHFEERRR